MHAKQLDHAGSTASILCAVHCAMSPLALPLIPLTAGRLLGPTLEWSFVSISLVLGIASLGHSYRVIHRDRRALALFTIGFTVLVTVRTFEPPGVLEALGVSAAAVLIVSAHMLNLRLRRIHTVGTCGCSCHAAD